MAHKITLYSDEELIRRVKRYAKKHNTSVSKIVNEFFKHLLSSEKDGTEAPLTDRLRGRIKGSGIDEEAYVRHLERKYL
jgi:hypothetical protein